MRQREQRLTFGEVADLYERVRPGYPDALLDRLVSGAGLDGSSRVLEIGCGTGKATRPMARRGLSITALEPAPGMAAVARRLLADHPGVRVVESTFEAFPASDASFDCVYAAQSLHWIPAEVRFARPARLLRAGGWMAFLANQPVREEAPVRAALDAVYARRAPHMKSGAPGSGPMAKEPLFEEFAACAAFEPAALHEFPWSQRYPTAEYLELMRTQSDHRMLDDDARDALLGEVAEVLDAHGGGFEQAYVARLAMARRRDRT